MTNKHTGITTRRTPGTIPAPSTAAVRRRMQSTRRRDTPKEIAVRQLLHARGLRYFVDRPVLPGSRRRPDLVFPRLRVAVFVDGCFWHSCPLHGTSPKANHDWWKAKLEANVVRDRDTDARLGEAGWAVVRVWEHEDPVHAADEIEEVVRRRATAP